MTSKAFARWAAFGAGLFYLAVTVAIFAAPHWFYENVGHFPPFNRHYMGDVAAFTLPLAVGLLLAARDPIRHRTLIALAALASIVHTANHAYDALANQITHGHWLADFTPLVLLVAALLAAYYRAGTDRPRPAMKI